MPENAAPFASLVFIGAGILIVLVVLAGLPVFHKEK